MIVLRTCTSRMERARTTRTRGLRPRCSGPFPVGVFRLATRRLARHRSRLRMTTLFTRNHVLGAAAARQYSSSFHWLAPSLQPICNPAVQVRTCPIGVIKGTEFHKAPANQCFVWTRVALGESGNPGSHPGGSPVRVRLAPSHERAWPQGAPAARAAAPDLRRRMA
jgi:hypothetical protein